MCVFLSLSGVSVSEFHFLLSNTLYDVSSVYMHCAISPVMRVRWRSACCCMSAIRTSNYLVSYVIVSLLFLTITPIRLLPAVVTPRVSAIMSLWILFMLALDDWKRLPTMNYSPQAPVV